ncbi:MAG: STAS domain-containing protein [Desulfobacterales bacterium]|nr:STAS domain-containing protein [Desulfobacterales bacterium]
MVIKSELSQDGKVLTLGIPDRFDISLFQSFTAAYKDKIESISKIVIDMSNTHYIDSSALGMLMLMRERAGGDTAKIDIVKSSPNVKKILVIANFQKLFNIE